MFEIIDHTKAIEENFDKFHNPYGEIIMLEKIERIGLHTCRG